MPFGQDPVSQIDRVLFFDSVEPLYYTELGKKLMWTKH
jgi:hypothetical protein